MATPKQSAEAPGWSTPRQRGRDDADGRTKPTASNALSPQQAAQPRRTGPRPHNKREPVPSPVITGLQARFGAALALASTAVLIKYGETDVLGSVAVRCLCGESIVQFGLGLVLRPGHPVLTPYHILLSGMVSGSLFALFPLDILRIDTAAVLIAVACLPVGLYMLYQGILAAQLDLHTSPKYWNFGFESTTSPLAPQGNGSELSNRNSFALTNQSPTSLLAVLKVVQMMIQLIEIGGVNAKDRTTLIEARNHFLYRVRNSSSLRHKAIATEILFRCVAQLLMRRTAMQIVSPESGTLSLMMEHQFLQRMLKQSEVVFRPLPGKLDPDSMLKWSALILSSMVVHKRLFKWFKTYQGGKLDPAIQASKYFSRFSILLYLSARFAIMQAKNSKSDNSSKLPPRMYL
mmetsp:Transcript_11328/g.20949  ORF Transcript_11328/g.20949 Transcript_11328/m.20949 type:complete len:404 (-) Transcript_11328:132-1343(-)